MTSCVPFPGTSTPGKNRGCAYTGPSTLKAPTLPNCLALTFCGVRVLSFKVAPVRKLSYCEVVTCATAAPEIAMNRGRLKRIHNLIRTPPALERGKSASLQHKLGASILDVFSVRGARRRAAPS